MNNRQRLHNTCLYDLLMRWTENLSKFKKGICILDVITGEKYPCKYTGIDDCKYCIQSWLNKEEKR